MKKLLATTLGIIRNREARRWTMFCLVLVALTMVLLGSTFLEKWTEHSLKIFIAFWAICGWLTLTAMLLAVFDILALRSAERRARKKLRQDVFGADNDEPKDGG